MYQIISSHQTPPHPNPPWIWPIGRVHPSNDLAPTPPVALEDLPRTRHPSGGSLTNEGESDATW